MKSLKFQFLTLLLSVASVCGYAQDQVSLTAQAPQSVEAGKVFRVDYILNTEAEDDTASLSGTSGFTVVMGPAVSRSSSITIVSGVQKKTTTTTYTYHFQAERAGNQMIPVCRLETRQGTYRSNRLPIEVLPGEGETETGSATPPARAGSEQTAGSGGSEGSEEAGDGDMFVRVELSSTSVAPGDSVTATVKLYSQRDVSSFGDMTFPTFEGFKVREVAWPGNVMPVARERFDGKRYSTVGLRQYILYPAKSGQLRITSGKYDIVVLSGETQESDPGDFFDTPQMSVEIVSLTSEAITLREGESSTDDDQNHDPNDYQIEPEVTEEEWVAEDEPLDDRTRKALLYGSVVVLFVLLGVYISKLGARRDEQYAAQERDGTSATNPSPVWHVPFLVGIVLMICIIAALW